MCHLFRKRFPPNLGDSTMGFLAIAPGLVFNTDDIDQLCQNSVIPKCQRTFCFIYLVGMTGIEPACDQLLFLRLIRLRRYIPIYLVRPERIERSLLTEYAPKAYGSTYSPKDAYQFFDFLFHHVKDLNQL